ncbi:hypothetical protein GCM10025867_32590 [Frondihabitans sucicola]|uniref:FHA domain-containing protein n=1 Tax=Frondihabitans sucicola TaxID=1268041 RepID=A0ABN6Y4Y9_9MICO|nr:FHA domain-containing protein [Frondihabitans sucicola]BDZ51018.1 hypothetical protein GCM10025867_32590 [Frondihabitans sucicola]
MRCPLTDEDIFCGECGTVVQSVAQSFTGPITPILTGVVPVGEGSAPPVESDEAAENPESGAQPERATGASEQTPATPPRPAPLAPTPVASDSPVPFVPEPAKPKKRRLFGRRGAEDAPELWSASTSGSAPAAVEPEAASTSVPAMPPAPEPVAPQPDPVAPPLRADQVPAPVDDGQPASPVQAPLAATPIDAPEQTADPVLAPLPDAPVVDKPAASWAINLGAPVDDVEKTRIVRRQPLGEPFVLQFSTGESFTVQGTGLVGRAPTPQPGEAIDLLVRIVDPGRSVSKTHLEFGQEDGTLWVSDRWSGNGSVVRAPSEQARRVEPGKRVRVPRGSRVEIGEQFFIVS